MKRYFTLIVCLAVFPLSGCHLLIGRLFSKNEFKNTLESAPVIPNPAKTGKATDTAVVGNDGTSYKMSAYSNAELCFDATMNTAPGEVQGLRYELEALKARDDDRDKVAKLTESTTRVLSSHSELRPVMRVERDELKDANGRVISYVERNVQRMEPHYETQTRICFAKPTIVTKETKYLVMVPASADAMKWMGSGRDLFAVWRLE